MAHHQEGRTSGERKKAYIKAIHSFMKRSKMSGCALNSEKDDGDGGKAIHDTEGIGKGKRGMKSANEGRLYLWQPTA